MCLHYCYILKLESSYREIHSLAFFFYTVMQPYYLFIFTSFLTKLEFGFYDSFIYGLFTPVKNNFPNKYNWINTNDGSSTNRCYPKKQLLLDLQKLKEWYFTNILEIRKKEPGRSLFLVKLQFNSLQLYHKKRQHLAVAASITAK